MLLSAYHRARLLMLAGIIVSIGVFEFASRQFHIPAYVGHGGAMLAEPNAFVSLLIVAVGLVVSVFLATLIAGSLRFDAGLFCAAIGMETLSVRGGTMGDVLRNSNAATHTIFIHFALELALIYALVAIAWSVLWGMHAGGYLKADEFRDGVEDTDEPMLFKISAMVMQVGVMAVLMMFLSQSDAKAQVIASIGISAFIGACIAYWMYPISPSPWLWMGPMIVGIIGYALAYFSIGTSEEWKIGQLDFRLAPLARPLPLDYASAGPAGAILGYWLSRKWHRQQVDENAAAESPPQAQ